MAGTEEHYGAEPQDETPLRDRPIEEIAGVLEDVLGDHLVAYGIHARDRRVIGAIARGEQTLGEEAEAVLRDIAAVTEELAKQNSNEAVRATMIGANPVLEDNKAPIELIHAGESARVAEVATQL